MHLPLTDVLRSMVTTARFLFPAAEVALADTFKQVPGARFALERTVEAGDGENSRVRASAHSEQRLRGALEDDPSVLQFQLVDEGATTDNGWLVDIDFRPTVQFLHSILLAEGGTITDAVGHQGRWVVSCRYADRATLSQVDTLLEERDFDFKVTRIQNGTKPERTDGGLTDDQYEALKHAYQKGHFNVPKDIRLAELGDDLDISHQAVSERIRRGLAEYLASTFPAPDDMSVSELESPAP